MFAAVPVSGRCIETDCRTEADMSDRMSSVLRHPDQNGWAERVLVHPLVQRLKRVTPHPLVKALNHRAFDEALADGMVARDAVAHLASSHRGITPEIETLVSIAAVLMHLGQCPFGDDTLAYALRERNVIPAASGRRFRNVMMLEALPLTDGERKWLRFLLSPNYPCPDPSLSFLQHVLHDKVVGISPVQFGQALRDVRRAFVPRSLEFDYRLPTVQSAITALYVKDQRLCYMPQFQESLAVVTLLREAVVKPTMQCECARQVQSMLIACVAYLDRQKLASLAQTIDAKTAPKTEPDAQKPLRISEAACDPRWWLRFDDRFIDTIASMKTATTDEESEVKQLAVDLQEELAAMDTRPLCPCSDGHWSQRGPIADAIRAVGISR